MKIIAACISLALVACTRGQATSSINYQRLFGIGCGRRVRSGTGGGGSGVAKGYFLPANSGGGASSSNIQGWGASSDSVKNLDGGSGASAFNLPGPISLPVGNSGAVSYGAPASSGGSGGNNNQAWGAGVNNVNNQGSGGSASGYNLQVSSGGNSGNNFQGWGVGAGEKSNQGSSGGSKFQGWVPIVGPANNHVGNGAAGGFNTPTTSYGAPSASVFAGGAINQAGGAGGTNFQGLNGGASNLPGPIDAAGDFSSPNTNHGASSAYRFSGGASNQGSNAGGISQDYSGGFSSGNFQGWGSGVGYNQGGNGGGSKSLPGPIGNAGGASHSHSIGPVSSSKQGGRGISGRSIQGNGLGGYQAVPVGYQTTEGRNIDPDLLQQIRSILLHEEASSSYGALSSGFGVPSSTYGAPSVGFGSGGSGHIGSGRVIGITIEGIDQSIEIAQFHQTTSGSDLFGGGSSLETLAIPSGSYGAPY